MKPYFIKYLPVEGEIKVGDKLRSESCSKHAVTVTEISDDIYWTDERDFQDPVEISYFGIRKDKAQKLGRLVLCSRKIEVGDKVYRKEMTGTIGEEVLQITNDGIYGDVAIYRLEDGSQTSDFCSNLFKIVGGIGPGAYSYIQENQEFDENEVKIKVDLGFGHFTNWIEGRENLGYTRVAFIKGPCGHFH